MDCVVGGSVDPIAGAGATGTGSGFASVAAAGSGAAVLGVASSPTSAAPVSLSVHPVDVISGEAGTIEAAPLMARLLRIHK